MGRSPARAEAKLVFVVADTHCGSTVGLCPPDTGLPDGGKYRLNVLQEWLWEQWLASRKWMLDLAGDDPWDLVINGDAIEGDHHRNKQVISADTKVHAAAANEALGLIATGANRTWMVHGTGTHVGHADESSIGFHLGAEQNRTTRYFCHQHVMFTMNKTVLSFRHHIATTKRKYLEGGALSIEAGNEQIAAARHDRTVPKVMGRAHRHAFGMYTDGAALMVVSPPWKLHDDHVEKVVPGAVPVVGSYALDFRNTPPNSIPEPRLFLRELPE